MTKIAVLMASNYSYGPPLDSKGKKEWVQEELNRDLVRLQDGGFDVVVAIDHLKKSSDGKLIFNQEAWDKIYRFEFLEFMSQNNLARQEGVEFFLLQDWQECLEKIPSHYSDTFRAIFSQGSASYNAKQEVEFYEEDLDRRLEFFAKALEDETLPIVFNMGGGSICNEHFGSRLANLRALKPSATTILGFSDGTYLPFYFSNKYKEVVLVQAQGLGDLSYLKEGISVNIKLKAVASSKLPKENIEACVSAISVRTLHDQLERGFVGKDIFNGKVAMLESTLDKGWEDMLYKMIDAGIFDGCKAVALGEFPIKDKEKFYEEFASELRKRKPEIPVLQSESEPSIFGHGSRRGQNIACAECTITTKGEYVGKNPIALSLSQAKKDDLQKGFWVAKVKAKEGAAAANRGEERQG